jgi:hypothetical protein
MRAPVVLEIEHDVHTFPVGVVQDVAELVRDRGSRSRVELMRAAVQHDRRGVPGLHGASTARRQPAPDNRDRQVLFGHGSEIWQWLGDPLDPGGELGGFESSASPASRHHLSDPSKHLRRL